MRIISIAIMFITLAAFTSGRTFDITNNKKEIKRQIPINEYKRNSIIDLLGKSEKSSVRNVVTSTQERCGDTMFPPRVGKRIVGGVEAKPHSWPSMVSIQRKNKHFCGGTLIERSVVLTAAHCVKPLSDSLNDCVAVLGAHNLYGSELIQKIKFKKIIVHPQYDEDLTRKDIALIVLQRDAGFNSYIQPACLPASSKDSPPVNSSVNVIGWGLTKEGGYLSDVLLQVAVTVLDPKFCKIPGIEETTEICAGQLSGGKDSCNGDSGGPLFAQNPSTKRFTVYGVVSRGEGCARPKLPGIYTRVAAHLDFINNNIPK